MKRRSISRISMPSFFIKHDPRSGISLLDTALVNTKKLNKSLQDMLLAWISFPESFWSRGITVLF